MIKRRSIFLILIAAAIVASASVRMLWRNGEPDAPPLGVAQYSDDVSRTIASTDEAIEFYQRRVARDPLDYISLNALGSIHMRKARATGDVAAYLRAEQSFRRSLELQPNNADTKALLAATLYSQHRFDEALSLSQEAFVESPQSLQALATLGDAQLELGDYTEAEDAYFELFRTTPSPSVLARLSHLEFLNGDTNRAIELMRQAAEEEAQSGQPKESVAWYFARLGDLYFSTGNLEESEEHYQASLDAFEGYYVGLAGLGKVRAAQGRYHDAIDLYERSVNIIPEPANLAALGDLYLYKEVGRADDAQLQYETVEIIAKLAAINEQVYNRELVLFYANHDTELDKALELAQAEIAIRKDIYGYDALAWALYKKGRYDEAANAISEALNLGTQDANLLYHAGLIFKAIGDNESARNYLRQALAINPNFSILHAEIAKAALSEVEQATVSLEATK